MASTNNNTENNSSGTGTTFTSYLGQEFQQKLMWQILVEPEFATKILPRLSTEYFDDVNLKRLYIIIMEYLNEYTKVPNLQNKSIYQAINLYKMPGNNVEEEILFSTIERVRLWNERVLNGDMLYDGDDVQKAANNFIKQQEYRKLGEFILLKTKAGNANKSDKFILSEIESRIELINSIGDEEDYGVEVFDDISSVLEPDFRQPIPTGVEVLDALTGGGLGKGEIGMALIPSGHGKTTLLTKIANTAYEIEKNVLQIFFEDTEKEIRRKHCTVWSKIPLSEIDRNREFVEMKVKEKQQEIGGRGKLVIKQFSQDGTKMSDIRNWIIKYQKKHGYKFDIVVLDYLDCLEPNKQTKDQNESELSIVKSFLALAADFNIPCWTAIQTNRGGFDSEIIEATHSGGSIKRLQKSHFFMSVVKPDKNTPLANIKILKARFANDGQVFKDCIFNNDSMEIRIIDNRYTYSKMLSDGSINDDIIRLNNKLKTVKETSQGLTYDTVLKPNNSTFELDIHKEISKNLPPIQQQSFIDGDVTTITNMAATFSDLLRKNNE